MNDSSEIDLASLQGWTVPTEPNFDPTPSGEAMNGLKNIPGITVLMAAAFNEHGIRSIDDLASCATDDLVGWTEHKDGQVVKYDGILGSCPVSRQDCEAMIIHARTKAGWI